MLHFKIIGVTWALLCLVGAAVFTPQLWSMTMDRQYGIGSEFGDGGFWAFQFFAELFLFAGVMLGVGLFRLRRWAAVGTRITATILLLYCLMFVLMAPFGVVWQIVGVFGVAFAGYSLFVVWRFKPYERPAS